MSIEAVTWAYKQKLKSSVKFVLVTLCDFANDEGRLFPSVATICERTCQDRKTVMNAIDELIKLGCLIDTGERKGGTGLVRVFQLNQIDLSTNSTKNGTVKTPNSTESGTVKQYQISHETVPNLVPRTIIEPLYEPLEEPSGELYTARARETAIIGMANLIKAETSIPINTAHPYILELAEKQIPLEKIREAIKKARHTLGNNARLSIGYIKAILDNESTKKPVQRKSIFEQNMEAAERAKEMIFGEEVTA